MLTIIRRIVFSTGGKIVAGLILVVIALAFAAGDITGLRPSGAGGTGNLVDVGGTKITEAELRQRLQLSLNAARQQNPSLDMSQFVNGGGFEQVVDQLETTIALEKFARNSGLATSKALVDGEIASIPAFQGFDGKFSEDTFRRALEQQRITPAQLRDDIARGMIVEWMTAPTIGASQVPAKLALPYASLLLERRQATVGFIPVSAIAPGAAPNAQELTAYYAQHRSRYTVPERRVVRYAVVSPDRFAELKPSEAEITQAYRAAGARFTGTEQRTLRQVVVADQKAAEALAAKVKGGAAIADAAKAAGLEASLTEKAEKAAFAQASTPAIADAAFAAADGAVVGPLKSPLGWHIVRVEGVTKVQGKTLDAARAELTAELTTRKKAEALSALREKLDGSIGDGATFAELAADAKAEAKTTPALLASGIDINNPTAQPDATLAAVLQGAFQAEQGDDPQMVPVGQDGGFAIVAVDRIVPAAPRPLKDIRDNVVRDFQIDRALRTARQAAVKAVQAVDKGTPLTQALAGTGIKVPPVQDINFSRQQLAASREQLPPAVELMFSMAENKAKLSAAPNRGGFFVVHLKKIERGDAKGNTALINQTRAGIGSVVGREYMQQFADAAKKAVGVKRDAAALAKLKAELGGQSAPAN